MTEKKLNIILICTNVATAFVGIIGTLLAFRLGYCKALDERFDASECKPARKWL